MIGVRTRAARAMAKVLDRMRVSYCDTRHMTKASNYKFIVKLPSGKKMDTVKHALAREGVICGGGVYEVPCHLHPVFKDVPYKKEELRVTETWCPRHICPPITSGLDDAQIDRMGAALSRVLA